MSIIEYLSNPILWLGVALIACGYVIGAIHGYQYFRKRLPKEDDR